MKGLFQTIIILGIPHWFVSVVEFIIYRKTSEYLISATFFLGIGFGGLIIYNKIKKLWKTNN